MRASTILLALSASTAYAQLNSIVQVGESIINGIPGVPSSIIAQISEHPGQVSSILSDLTSYAKAHETALSSYIAHHPLPTSIAASLTAPMLTGAGATPTSGDTSGAGGDSGAAGAIRPPGFALTVMAAAGAAVFGAAILL